MNTLIKSIVFSIKAIKSNFKKAIDFIKTSTTRKTAILFFCILFLVAFSKIQLFLPTDKFDLNFRYELYDISKLTTILFTFCWIYLVESWDVKNLPSKIFSFFFILETLKEILDRIIDRNCYEPVGDIFQSIVMLLSMIFVIYCFMLKNISLRNINFENGYFIVIKKPGFLIPKIFASFGLIHGSISMIKVENGDMYMYSYINSVFTKKRVGDLDVKNLIISSFKIDDRLVYNCEKIDLYLNNHIGSKWSIRHNCVFVFREAIYSIGLKRNFFDFIPLYFFKRISIY